MADGLLGAMVAGPVNALIGAAVGGVREKNLISVPLVDEAGNWFVLQFGGSEADWNGFVMMVNRP